MPLTIELPSLEGQTAFNVRRWREVLADPFREKLPHRIETDRHGHIVMSPPPAFSHGRRQAKIAGQMLKLMPEGQAVTECPLSTSDGGKAIDVAWISPAREENASEPVVLERAHWNARPKSPWKSFRPRTHLLKSSTRLRLISTPR